MLHAEALSEAHLLELKAEKKRLGPPASSVPRGTAMFVSWCEEKQERHGRAAGPPFSPIHIQLEISLSNEFLRRIYTSTLKKEQHMTNTFPTLNCSIHLPNCSPPAGLEVLSKSQGKEIDRLSRQSRDPGGAEGGEAMDGHERNAMDGHLTGLAKQGFRWGEGRS